VCQSWRSDHNSWKDFSPTSTLYLNHITFSPSSVLIVTGLGAMNIDMVATRKGTVWLTLDENSTITLKNSLYVPNLSTNLISFVQLIKNKVFLHFERCKA
jgi:hypothetical protein